MNIVAVNDVGIPEKNITFYNFCNCQGEKSKSIRKFSNVQIFFILNKINRYFAYRMFYFINFYTFVFIIVGTFDSAYHNSFLPTQLQNFIIWQNYSYIYPFFF